MINESHAEEPLMQTSKKEKSDIPKEKIMNRLIKDEFRFERRLYLFHSVNTINIILTSFNLISPINLEGQKSLIYYEETRQLAQHTNLTLINLINGLIFIHLLRVFTCVLGYFSVQQKSGKLMTYFMIMSTVCVLCRGIVSLLIILNFQQIKQVCNEIFGNDSSEDSPGSLMAIQFLIVLLLFVVIEIFLALISLIQCSKSKEEYTIAVKHKERLMKSYNLCYEIAIYQLDE